MDLGLMLQNRELQYAVTTQELEVCNKLAEPYGLSLTGEQMQALSRRRFEALKETERIEFGRGILPELVAAFAPSPYVQSDDFDSILAELQTIFYRLKGEVDEKIADDALIDALRFVFDEESHGSIELLEAVPVAKLLELSRRAGQDANDDWSESDAYEEKGSKTEEMEEDELARVYDDGRYDRPGNIYAGMFYDDHDEVYRIVGDFDSRIGGSSLG